VPTSLDRVLPAGSPKRVLEVSIPPFFPPHGDTYQWAGKRRLNPNKRDAMSNDQYKQIFEDLTRDLYAVAKRHGKRALREAVRDAAHGNLLQEEEDESIPPEELDYPDEDVWTLPPPPDEREDEEGDSEEDESADDEHELSDAAQKVLSDLMDRLKKKAEK